MAQYQSQNQQHYQQNNNNIRQQLDNSMSFKKTFDSLLIKSQTPGLDTKKNSKFQKNTSRSPPIPPRKKKVDDLNKWSYCNPENIQDELPQPFRFVNKVLQDLILKPVYQQIFDIEKHREDPNYEGNAREVLPQGNFNINGISCMNKHKGNQQNHILAGDKFGNIPQKRIQNISSVTLPYVDQYMSTIAVIGRAHNEVLIYRSLSNENQFYLQFKIKLTEEINPDSTYGEFPLHSQFSQDGDFIFITNYKGDLKVFKIPEPPQPILEQAVQEEQNMLGLPNQQYASNQSVVIQKLGIMNLEVSEPQTIEEQFYEVKFEGQFKMYDYDLYLKKLQQDSMKAIKQEQVVDPKAAKKGGKKEQQQEEEPEEEQVELKDEYEFNLDEKFPEYIYNEKHGDISDDIPDPKFYPQAYFTQSSISIQNKEKIFGKIRQIHLTTGILVCWSNQKKYHIHKLQPAKPEYLNEYTYNIYFQEPGYINQQKILKEAQTFMPPKLMESSELLYKITKTSISASETMLGFGMDNGTIMIYDLLLNQEKFYLDKHVDSITALEFFENYKLISGSLDGGVHIYNLEKGKVEMKRTNLFKSKQDYSIKEIKVSNIGVAFVLDSLANLRMYDLYHSDKIAKMNIFPNLNGKTPSGFILDPYVIMDGQKEQLAIVCEENKDLEIDSERSSQQILQNQIGSNENVNNQQNQKSQENVNQEQNNENQDQQQKSNQSLQQNNSWTKTTRLYMFKIHEAFISLFPGYSNVFNQLRQQTDKRHEIVNIFGKLALNELKDPDFEIPQLGGGGTSMAGPTLHVKYDSKLGSQSGTLGGMNSTLNKKQSQRMRQSGVTRQSGIKNNNSSMDQQSTNNMSKIQSQKMKSSVLSKTQQRQKYSPQKSIASKSNRSIGWTQEESELDFNQSFRTQRTHVSQKNKINLQQKQQKGGLTKELLHPEEYLLQKIQLPTDNLIDENQHCIEDIRKRIPNKQTRQARIAKRITSIKQELQVREERAVLERKKLMLTK